MNKKKETKLNDIEIMYLDKDKSIQDIAKYYGCSTMQIYRHLVGRNISRYKPITKVQLSPGLNRIIMAKYLKRELSPMEVVHFRDGDPNNLATSNLYLFESKAMHAFYHGHINRADFITPEKYVSTIGKRLKETYYSTSWLFLNYVLLGLPCASIAKDLKIGRTTVTQKLKRTYFHGKTLFSLRTPTVNQHDMVKPIETKA